MTDPPVVAVFALALEQAALGDAVLEDVEGNSLVMGDLRRRWLALRFMT